MMFKKFLVLASIVALAQAEEFTNFKIHGSTWFEAGRIMQATDTLINGPAPDNVLNLNGNVLQGLGAQFTVQAALSEHLEAVMGFGVQRQTHALGSSNTSFLAISLFQNFLTESKLTYSLGEKIDPYLSFTVGSYSYKYNSNVKNLGLYLLRGPVYPGILMGGFGDFATDTTKSTMLGFKAHNKMGIFTQDLILQNERDIPPTLDWSLAYIAKVNTGAFEAGVGANFYRLIPYNSKLETPGKSFSDAELGFKKDRYIDVAPGTTDTTFYTHQGTKLMAMFSLDLQKMFGIEWTNPDDLKLYGEVGVIGVKNYGRAYDNIMHRIPAMIGFNIPTGGFLNHLSIEAEYYGALYRSDLARVGNNNVVAPWTIKGHPIASPKPVDYTDYGIDTITTTWVKLDLNDTLKNVVVQVKGTALDKINQTLDNFKWSLYADKVLSKHISVIAQVANDHYRPNPVSTGLIKSEGGTQEAFASPKDWYFMLRMGYFF